MSRAGGIGGGGGGEGVGGVTEATGGTGNQSISTCILSHIYWCVLLETLESAIRFLGVRATDLEPRIAKSRQNVTSAYRRPASFLSFTHSLAFSVPPPFARVTVIVELIARAININNCLSLWHSLTLVLARFLS